MKLTHKAVARMSGYVVWFWDRGDERRYQWEQFNIKHNYAQDDCMDSFATEQEAYEDCCRVCGLVEFEEGE